MNFKNKLFFVFISIFLILITISASSAESHFKLSSELKQKVEASSSSDSIDVIVTLKDNSQNEVILNEGISNKLKHKYSLVNSFSAQLTKSEIDNLEKNGKVEKIYYPKTFSIALQNSILQINADDVWNKQLNSVNITGSGQAICVLDTGINSSHSSFSGRIIQQHCYESLAPYCPNSLTEDTNAADDHGHGTHVAGIAAASVGINGVAKGASIVAIKIMNKTGSGTSSDLISAIEWCVNNSVQYNITAISMSLGTATLYSNYCDSEDTVTTNLINQAVAKNITVLIAAGNNGNSTAISWPACIENATAVGGVNKTDAISYNRWNKNNFLLAPGVSINSTWINGAYYLDSGTSMAAPHAAGAVALLQQYSMQKNNRQLTAAEIRNALKNNGVNISDSSSNLTRIDVLAAVRSLSFYRIINQSDQNSLIQTNENSSINFTNINNAAEISIEKIINKNLWTITSNLTSGTFNVTAKFFYNSNDLTSSLFSNAAVMRWTNLTASGSLNATINRTESSALVQTNHFTDFLFDANTKVNGTNIAPVATKCDTILGIISLNVSNKAQNDNITQIIVSSKNSNDSSISVLLCNDDGNFIFNSAIDCNTTLKLNTTNFINGNTTFSNIIYVANNTDKTLYIAYNISSCQNNDIFDLMIPDMGITMQRSGTSVGSINPNGNSTSDSSAPYYTSITVSNYTYSSNYSFYSTWLDNSQVQAAWLEINNTGNYTSTKSGNDFTANVTNIAVGNYTFRWWANDSVSNLNQSSWFTSVISKANSSINLTINGSDSDKIINVNAVLNKTAILLIPSSGNILLYENGTLIANGTTIISNVTNYTSSGTFNITTIYPETQNYSFSSHTHFITVQDTTTPPTSYKISPTHNSYNNSKSQVFQANATDASLNNATLYIYSSGLILHNNISLISGNFANVNWNYTFSSDGIYTWNALTCDILNNCNWSDSGNWTVIIDSTKPLVSLSISPTSITTSESSNVACSTTDTNLYRITLTIGASVTTCSSSPCSDSYSSSSTGTKTVTCLVEDKAGNTNSTASSLTVTQASSTSQNPENGGGTLTVTVPQNQPSPITQLPQIIDSRNINVIVGGTNYSMSINKETTISDVMISAKNTISNSQFSVKKLAAKPDEISAPLNSVYSYVEVVTDINEIDIENAIITFEISKSWLENVDLKTVVMQRYHGGQWHSLETRQLDETDNSYIFNTISPGFSVFAITARKEITFGIMGSCGDGACNGNETKINCCKDCGCESNQTCSSNKCIGEQEKITTLAVWLLIAVAFIIIIRIGVAFWPKLSEKLDKFKIKRKFHPKK